MPSNIASAKNSAPVTLPQRPPFNSANQAHTKGNSKVEK